MDGWWKRDSYFIRYMAREATAVFVAAQVMRLAPVAFLGISALTCWIAIVFALRAWPA